MKAVCLKHFAVIAAVLAASSATTTTASAATGDTPLPVSTGAVMPSAGLALDTSGLFGNAAEADRAPEVLVVARRLQKRRFALPKPRRTVARHQVRRPASLKSRSNAGTHAPASLDCSNQSHPDCNRPSSTLPIVLMPAPLNL